ncbi:MAG: hypothetical protein V3T84_04705 [Phycisphaerales bacterium]
MMVTGVNPLNSFGSGSTAASASSRGNTFSAKARRRGRYVTFQLAEVAVPRDLFQKILRLIGDLRPCSTPA